VPGQFDLTLDRTVTRLRAAGCVFAEDEARLLHDHARTPAQLDLLVARRAGGEPLEQLLGWVLFCGLRVPVAPGLFVPRVRTELLAETAVELCTGPTPVVVDLCCGTGAIALVVRTRVGRAEVHAADLDPAAVRRARATLGRHVHEGDLFDALPQHLRGRVDVLAVNAPYVPTGAIGALPREARDHEAHLALDGGPDGLAVHARLAAGARDWLAPTGTLVLETSAAQCAGSQRLLSDAGLFTAVRRDEARGADVVLATLP
jgi:release factor glutamine methyltransferase